MTSEQAEVWWLWGDTVERRARLIPGCLLTTPQAHAVPTLYT